jgi:uncharacterized protein
MQPPQRLALLVGGPSGESSYADEDWAALFQLIETVASGGVSWLVTNARRTPGTVSDRLRELALRPASAIETFIDCRSSTARPLADILRASDAAVVTDDSSSMVSDAVAAGLAVIGIAPRQHAPTRNEQEYRDHLASHGWYRSMALHGLTPQDLLTALDGLTPLQEDPADALAALLAKRLPRLFADGGRR